MLTLAGAEGSTKQSETIDSLFGPFKGDSSYDTHGFIGSFVFGRVFDTESAKSLKDSGAGSSPIKLDLRAGIAYQDFSSSTFTDASFARLQANLSSWVGSASATFFTQLPMNGGAVWRPYIKAEVRQQFSYDNEVNLVSAAVPTALSNFKTKFTQNDTMGVGEVGFDYVMSDVTFSAAVYVEESGDQETVGGRAGLKFKLR